MLVRDDNGEESILLGKGIGYGRKAGQEIDRQPSDRVFIPLSNPTPSPCWNCSPPSRRSTWN